MKLFKNTQYTVLLIIGFICYFYQTAMNVYAPIGAMKVMGTSIIIYFVALTITGIAESYRSVSITPSTQATLQPEDMGVGTSLVNFVNSLANTIAAAVFGVAYDLNTASDPTNVSNIQNGVNAVFWLAAIVSAIGFLLVIFVVRPKMTAKAE